MLQNSEIRTAARDAFNEKGWPILATFIFFLINFFSTAGNSVRLPVLVPCTSLICLFVFIPVGYGYMNAFLPFLRNEDQDSKSFLKNMFSSFRDGTYWRAIGLSLLMTLFVILWSLLLFIPGIVKAYAYRMAFFISRDNPELSVMECLQKSQEMMRGYKMQMFLLDLSFIGWGILCLLSAGIGFLWLQPYVCASYAKFYEEQLKDLQVFQQEVC